MDATTTPVAGQSLSPDALLTTTRAVRRRLDLDRPVERALIEECLAVAQQAPAQANLQSWSWVVVTDPAKRAAIGELYRRAWHEIYLTLPFAAPNLHFGDPARDATQARVTGSAAYLVKRIQDVPVHVIPCISPRTDGLPHAAHSALWARSRRRRGASCSRRGRAAWGRAGPVCTCSSRSRWPGSSASRTPR
jgi:nitroreductase